jgi:preprotein translocase subunit Sec63
MEKSETQRILDSGIFRKSSVYIVSLSISLWFIASFLLRKINNSDTLKTKIHEPQEIH